MEIKSLGGSTMEQVYTAFGRAFSDYEVRFDLPLAKFEEMLTTRDVNFDYSIGCFDGEELVSFILCGYRKRGDLQFCYDGGTGTVKEYRQQGIGKKLVNAWLEDLRRHEINQVILEVLENNAAAITLYHKAGFQVSRTLPCYRRPKSEVPVTATPYAIDDNIQHYLTLDTTELLTFQPSWQNAKESVLNVIDRYAYVGIMDGDCCIGYGLVHTVSGNIAQIGVAAAHRNTGLEHVLMSELAQRTNSESLTFVNVEQGDYIEEKLRTAGFDRFIGQYEMIYAFSK